jgi:hypothetical protein
MRAWWLDFFEPVDGFKTKPAQKEDGQKEQGCDHLILIFDSGHAKAIPVYYNRN